MNTVGRFAGSAGVTAPASLLARMTSPAPDPEALVRRHQAGLWRYLRALGAPAELAEDLLHDTFLVALRKLEHDEGNGAIAAFLRQTARHLHLRRMRDQSRRRQILIELAD